jgi:hypothetical protein
MRWKQMKKPKNLQYSVSEAEILKISKLMGCLEDSVKEIIRSTHQEHDEIGPSEMYFYEMSSRALGELETDDELRHYFDIDN